MLSVEPFFWLTLLYLLPGAVYLIWRSIGQNDTQELIIRNHGVSDDKAEVLNQIHVGQVDKLMMMKKKKRKKSTVMKRSH